MSVIARFQHLTLVHHETLTFLPCAVWNSTNPGRAVRVDNTALSAIGKSEPLLKNEEGGFPSPIENAGSRGASQSPQWVKNFVPDSPTKYDWLGRKSVRVIITAECSQLTCRKPPRIPSTYTWLLERNHQVPYRI